MLDIILLPPGWIKSLVSLGLGVIFICLWLWSLSDRNKKKLNSRKPILLPQLKADIDYINSVAEGMCNFCIPMIDENHTISDDIDSCLRRDLESINKDIKIYNSQAETLIDELNLKITNFVKQKIPNEWNATDGTKEPMRYYTKRIYSEIGDHVKFRNEKRYGKRECRLGLSRNKDGVNRWNLLLEGTLVASDSENEIDEIQKTIAEFFDNVIDGVKFKRLNEFFEQIRREHEKVEIVISDLENGFMLKEE